MLIETTDVLKIRVLKVHAARLAQSLQNSHDCTELAFWCPRTLSDVRALAPLSCRFSGDELATWLRGHAVNTQK